MENNRERTGQEGHIEIKLQNNEINTYAREKEEKKGVIRQCQE